MRIVNSGLSWTETFIIVVRTILFVVANVSAVSREGFFGLVAIAFLCWLNTKGKMKLLLVLLATAGIFVILISESYKE